MDSSSIVIIESERYDYPKHAPFRPSDMYPENPFPEAECDKENYIYGMVREGFRLSQYDLEHFGAKEWNPLGGLIHPGSTVLIKPNLVTDFNPSGGGTDCLYTQPSVVAAVCDYVIIALNGTGRIIIADAPVQECDFEKLIRDSGYLALLHFYQKHLPEGISIELTDMRGIRSKPGGAGLFEYYSSDVPSTTVNLGGESEFSDVAEDKIRNMRITNYDPAILQKHHNAMNHEYCISALVLDADVVINMPKPKTHRKAGATAALKNMVGINARKEYLPHHTNGSFRNGGDEYLHRSLVKSIKNFALDQKNHYNQGVGNRLLALPFQMLNRITDACMRLIFWDRYYEGSWYGNTTISRTIIDLNKILLYADKQGRMQESQQRQYLIVADMIVCGEKEGPLQPMPKNVGWIAMGDNPVAFDEIIMTLMGAKTEMISTLVQAKKQHGKYKVPICAEDPVIVSNGKLNGKMRGTLKKNDILYFEPTSGWRPAYRHQTKGREL